MQPFYLHGGELYQVDANGRPGDGTQYTDRARGQGEQGVIYNNFLSYEYGDQSQFNAQNESVLDEYVANVLNQPEDQGYPQSPRDELSPGAETTSTVESPTSVGDQVNPVSAEDGVLETEPGPYERYVWQRLQDVYYGPVVTNYGTLSFVLRHRMRVDLTVDYAIRIVNFARHCSAAISSWGESSSMCHARGCAFQERMNADVATGPRRAKISSRGVTFTALNHGLVYLVDDTGTTSTSESFEELNYDLSMRVFCSNSERGMDVFEDCVKLMGSSRSHTTMNGEDMWIVGGVRIKQTARGDVQVSRSSGELVIRCSTGGTIFVATPSIKMGASWNRSSYIFARMAGKSISGSADGLAVKNGSQEAGLDRRGRLTLP